MRKNQYNQIIASLLLLIVLVTSCNYFENHENEIESGINIEQLKSEISITLNDTIFLSSLTNIEKTLIDTIPTLYSSNSYSPIWISEYVDTLQIESLLNFFDKVTTHGLNPERYYYSNLTGKYYSLIKNKEKQVIEDYSALAKVEILLSLSFLQYQKNILYGVINPREHDKENYDIPIVERSENIYDNLFHKDKLNVLNRIQPTSRRYVGLQNALKFYEDFSKSVNWVTIPPLNGKIEIGKQSTLLNPIAQNLMSLGLLDSSYHLPFPPSYDTTLFEAIKRFQALYGLKDDGVIGFQTVEQLSISPSERVEQIKVNLERFRWTAYTDSLSYILVNIPDFTLYAYKNRELKTTIKVCVGQKRERNYDQKIEVYRKTKKWAHLPKNFETPQVYSRINQIITNPPWNVPTSIAKNETYYEIKKDSNYLNDKKFKVLQGGKVIDHNEINWKEYSPTNLPFSFVQEPGWANALGRMKFMFRNKYDIYLHDTPTRGPFATANRAVSHGCVRVEKPIQFAEFITSLTNQSSLDEVRMELGMRPENPDRLKNYKTANNRTKYFNLDSTIPLYVDYFTAWVDENNQLQFRPDVYEKDKKLFMALKEVEKF
ncbi:MAG TPA: L,D-transpeptidase family protein [Ignavibacteriaceae bacterium]|nr:L,D-transpeptidase family protein [Ignavibacteriaceae bacterium]